MAILPEIKPPNLSQFAVLVQKARALGNASMQPLMDPTKKLESGHCFVQLIAVENPINILRQRCRAKP